jgi:hypothetical protein
MAAGKCAGVHRPCAKCLTGLSEFHRVQTCDIRVLAVRPLRAREPWVTELFGDYNPETMLIRVWMRTAVREEIMSSGISESPCGTSSAITWVFNVSDFATRGTHAASTSVVPHCTI